jgi:hypothetical protein
VQRGAVETIVSADFSFLPVTASGGVPRCPGVDEIQPKMSLSIYFEIKIGKRSGASS